MAMGTTESNSINAAAPARKAVLITKADADLATPVKALRVYVAAGAGPVTLKVTPADDLDADAVTLTYPDGLHREDLGVRKVWATGSAGAATIHGYL